ncbi:MAG TPA: aspartyl protease family protein [Steroidobacteraceae bacterium]|nr:aspartyl protease family protein [Steroidobacteraceae bacterium]
MFQYTSQHDMYNIVRHCALPALCVLAGMMLAGCAATSSQPAVPEVAAIGPGGDDAQYAISTRSDRIGRIVIPVSINGQPDFRLMLDTGATHSVLTSKAAARLGIDVTQADTSEVQGVLGRMTAPVVKVDQLQSGTLKLQNLRVPVIDGSVVSELDGILGVDGMGDKTITADFVHDRIRISDAIGLAPNALFAVIKFSLVSHRLVVVDGMVGHIRVSAVIDTGGTQTLGNMALLDALTRKNKDQAMLESGVIDITNSSQDGRLLLVPSVKLGPADITNAAVLFSDFGVFKVWHLDKRPALLIGMDVLGQLGELSINYGRNELQVRAR